MQSSIKEINLGEYITDEQISAIRNVDYFKDTQYADLDIAATIEFFAARYVQQIFEFNNVNANTVITDIGAGFGWLTIAFAIFTDAKIIGVEPDKPRLKPSLDIASIFNEHSKLGIFIFHNVFFKTMVILQ